MSLLRLNIIPEEYETRFRVRRIYITARQLMMILIIYMLLLASLLLLARFILQREFTRIVNETSLVTADNRALERKVDTLNDFVKSISVVQNKHIAWTPIMLNVSEATPPGVILNNIVFDSEKNGTISGTANTRNDLLTLRDNLNTISAFTDINLPITDLVTSQNLTFNLKFKVDPTKLTP